MEGVYIIFQILIITMELIKLVITECIKETFEMESIMVLGHVGGLMEGLTQENGNMEWQMAREWKLMEMEVLFMMDIGKTTSP